MRKNYNTFFAALACLLIVIAFSSAHAQEASSNKNSATKRASAKKTGDKAGSATARNQNAQSEKKPAASKSTTAKKPAATAKRESATNSNEDAGTQTTSPAARTERARSTRSRSSAAKKTESEAGETGASEKSAERRAEETTQGEEKTGLKSGAGKSSTSKAAKASAARASAEDEKLQAELAALKSLPSAERIEKLREFIEAHPDSAVKLRAVELLVSVRAALGDEKLQAGDVAGGIEQIRQAIAEAPPEMSDRLYAGVVVQLPTNLFMRGERAAALEAAHAIEEKVKTDANRLLILMGFYMGIEQADEAARLGQLVTQLEPEMSTAHHALGSAYQIGLDLNKAAAEYSRALELDPHFTRSRRSLADLRRAAGQTEEALILYRQLLADDQNDKQARTGFILALFDAGKAEEAARELDNALKNDPRNFALLTGAAYWYAAHRNAEHALELAGRAVSIEPRYTWAQIALARALVLRGQPFEAERVLRFARQYGRFPTLDYELAAALAAGGLYDEAAAELARSFTIKNGEIEAALAGHRLTRSDNFLDLLEPERRASIFQATGDSSEAEARVLKGLLAFHAAMNQGGDAQSVNESAALTAAQDFVSGDDPMRAYRQLYVASRLLRAGRALPHVLEFTDAAMSAVESALDVPVAPFAIQADELAAVHASAINNGVTMTTTSLPRNLLSNLLRGRIEDIAGWALFNLDRSNEAVVRLKRAAGILPETSALWRATMWHLGAALEASGNRTEALAAYIKSYSRGEPDDTRRATIEALYRKVNGTLDGLEAQIGSAARLTPPGTTREFKRDTLPSAQTASNAATARVTETKNIPQTSSIAEEKPTVAPRAVATQTPAANEKPAPLEKVSEQKETAQAAPQATSESQPTTEPAPTPLPEATPAARPRRQTSAAANQCSITSSEEELTIKSNGGSSKLTLTLDGWSGRGDVSATTSDWPDVAVFAEPRGTNPNAFVYSITSVSKRVGTFVVTFKTPCGMKKVTVHVEAR